jgi:hypothetical protein
MNSKNAAVLHLLGAQPRDQHGRYTTPEPPARTISFDGGARESAPLPSDPARDHATFLLSVIQAKQGQSSDW